MLELLGERETGLQVILTGNVDTSKHMIAINEALGSQELDRRRSWQLDLARQPF
jgi:hypothetical protein